MIGFPYILKICNTLPILQNMQHIAHDAKHAIHFILCKICNIFYADAIDLKGGAAFGRPPLAVNKICICIGICIGMYIGICIGVYIGICIGVYIGI